VASWNRWARPGSTRTGFACRRNRHIVVSTIAALGRPSDRPRRPSSARRPLQAGSALAVPPISRPVGPVGPARGTCRCGPGPIPSRIRKAAGIAPDSGRRAAGRPHRCHPDDA
jgi:hypothetical protein